MGDWLYQLTMSWLLRGNAYGLVLERDGVGRPSQVLLQHPDDVQAQRAEDGSVVWRVRGQVVDPGRMWHQRVYPIPGSILGMSPVSMHATTIGLGISAERFGEQWFADGAHPSGMLVNDSAKDITPEQATTLKQRFMAAVRGTREPVVMGQGWRYQQLQIAPNESQFLETQQMTSAECARIFGPGMPEILGYATGGNLTYANVEQRSLDLLTYALDPWLVRIEKILTEHLPAPRYVRFNRNALLRTDTLTRYQAHEIALRAKFNVVNEIRDLEDLPPVPWGDTPVPVETKTQEAQSVPQLIPAPGGTDG
jgi:HK97 family phage portal protein